MRGARYNQIALSIIPKERSYLAEGCYSCSSVPQSNSRIANTYRGLKVWLKSIDLAEQVYRLTESFPHAEMYELAKQMRRAAVSIASNIAEGWGRRSRREYSKFILIARGSNDELQTQLVIVERLGFAEAAHLCSVIELSDEVGRMLNGLYTFLQNPRRTGRDS